ncbi:MAG TPA: hypothetical protein EYM96_13400 [Rhodospirillales bacterium]|nr:hypothetical protein [Rhodospirillales bacterium]
MLLRTGLPVAAPRLAAPTFQHFHRYGPTPTADFLPLLHQLQSIEEFAMVLGWNCEACCSVK